MIQRRKCPWHDPSIVITVKQNHERNVLNVYKRCSPKIQEECKEYSGKEWKKSSIDQLNKINWYSNKTDSGSRDDPVENTYKGYLLFGKAMAEQLRVTRKEVPKDFSAPTKTLWIIKKKKKNASTEHNLGMCKKGSNQHYLEWHNYNSTGQVPFNARKETEEINKRN